MGPAVRAQRARTQSPRQRGGETIFSLSDLPAGRKWATAWAMLAVLRQERAAVGGPLRAAMAPTSNVSRVSASSAWAYSVETGLFASNQSTAL